MTAVLILKSNLSLTCYSNVSHALHFHLLNLVVPLLPSTGSASPPLQWSPRPSSWVSWSPRSHSTSASLVSLHPSSSPFYFHFNKQTFLESYVSRTLSFPFLFFPQFFSLSPGKKYLPTWSKSNRKLVGVFNLNSIRVCKEFFSGSTAGNQQAHFHRAH